MTRVNKYDYPHQESVEDHFISGWIASAALLIFSALVVLVVRVLA